MPRKRPISYLVDVRELADDSNPPPAKRQKQVTTRYVARDITIPVHVSPPVLTLHAPRRGPIVWRNVDCINEPFFNAKINIDREELAAIRQSISRKRPVSDILDSSIDEEIQIKGKPIKKKSKNVLSDSLSEVFNLLSDSSDSEMDSDDDIFNSFVEDRHDSASTEHDQVNIKTVPYPKTHNKIIDFTIKKKDTSVQCQSNVQPCEKHKPAHQEPANHMYPCYELPKLDETPLRCDGEIDNIVSKAHLFSIKRIIICNGQPSITLYTREIFSLFKTQQNDLHLCRTFNLGPCYITMFVIRQKNLIKKSSKNNTAPLFVGPVLLHFDRSVDTYEEFLSNIRDKFDLPYDVYNGELKGIPKNDRSLVEATRSVFGLNMQLAGRQHGTGSIRKEIHDGSQGIKPTDTIESVVRHIEKWIFNMQSDSMQTAFQGERDGDYKMTASARKHVSQLYKCQDAYQKFLELVPDC